MKRKEFEENIRQNENDPEKCRSIVEQQMVMYKKNLEKRILTVKDLSRAEIELVKYSQRQTYMEEIQALQFYLQTGSILARGCVESRRTFEQIGDA